MSINKLKGYTDIDIASVGGVLTLTGTGGLILPKGTTAQRPSMNNGLIRYNTTDNTVELMINNEIVAFSGAISGGGNTGTYLPRSGGSMIGPITMMDGTNIVLDGTATVDGVKPSALQTTLDLIGGGTGFIVRGGGTYRHRSLVGANGIEILNPEGLTENPVISAKNFTVTFGGDVKDVNGNAPVLNVSGLSDASVDFYIKTKSSSISDLQETVEDYVGDMVAKGTQTGMTVTYQDNAGLQTYGRLNFSANPYTITFDNTSGTKSHLVGSLTIPANRANLLWDAKLNTNMTEIKLLGSAQNNAMGSRLRYSANSTMYGDPHSTYLENNYDDELSGIVFLTRASSLTPQVALALRDGQMYASTATITTQTSNQITTTNLNATTAIIGTLTNTSANITTLVNTNATITDLHVTNDANIDGDLAVSGTGIIQGNVTINGSLFVNGPTTTVVSTTTTVKDPIVVFNEGEKNSGVTNGIAGMKIDRGLVDDVAILWDEAIDTFIPTSLDAAETSTGRVHFGMVANPTQDYHVGDRLYNDTRYVRDPAGGVNGIVVNVSPTGESVARTIEVGPGLSIQNANGVSGNPSVSLNPWDLTLTGPVTGTVTITPGGNISMQTFTHAADPDFRESVEDVVGGMVVGNNEAGISVTYDDTTNKLNFDVDDFALTLNGDVTGSALISNLSNTTLTVTVLDDSHIHDGRYYTEMEIDASFEGKSNDKYQVDWARVINRGSPVVNLSGDCTGTTTLTGLGNGPYTLEVTVLDDSHIHDGRYYTKSQADANYVNVGGDTMTGTLYSRSIAPVADVSYDLGSPAQKYNYVYGNVFSGTANRALYADLAERYEADAYLEPGTVVVFGGDKEITKATKFMDTRVAGVISTQPAYMMNSEAGDDATHPYVGLKGRVPCKVVGPVQKGDMLVVSNVPGAGCACEEPRIGSVFAKALESWDGAGIGVIEVALMSA